MLNDLRHVTADAARKAYEMSEMRLGSAQIFSTCDHHRISAAVQQYVCGVNLSSPGTPPVIHLKK